MTIKPSDTPSLLLCALRAVGGAAFLAPGVGARQLDVRDDAETTYLVRLFAARKTLAPLETFCCDPAWA